jgi:hypothetical protein
MRDGFDPLANRKADQRCLGQTHRACELRSARRGRAQALYGPFSAAAAGSHNSQIRREPSHCLARLLDACSELIRTLRRQLKRSTTSTAGPASTRSTSAAGTTSSGRAAGTAAAYLAKVDPLKLRLNALRDLTADLLPRISRVVGFDSDIDLSNEAISHRIAP